MVAVGVLTYATVVDGGKTIKTIASAAGATAGSLTPRITEIAGKYDMFKCVPCADKIKSVIQNAGLQGEQISIQFSQKGDIWNNTIDKVISENGFHTGILFDGKVYDNIYKTGITLEKWLAAFEGLGEKVITKQGF